MVAATRVKVKLVGAEDKMKERVEVFVAPLSSSSSTPMIMMMIMMLTGVMKIVTMITLPFQRRPCGN